VSEYTDDKAIVNCGKEKKLKMTQKNFIAANCLADSLQRAATFYAEKHLSR